MTSTLHLFDLLNGLCVLAGIAILVFSVRIRRGVLRADPTVPGRKRWTVVGVFAVCLPLGVLWAALRIRYEAFPSDALPAVGIASFTGVAALMGLFVACLPRATVISRFLSIGASLLLALPSVFMVLVLFPELVDGRFRTFKSFYTEIRVDMSRAEVMETLHRNYPVEGSRHQPKLWTDTDTELVFFMDPERSTEPNCEGILLDLKEGRVVRKRYSMD